MWLKLNKLSLNIDKTKFMIFHKPKKQIEIPNLKIDNIDIEYVEHFDISVGIDTLAKLQKQFNKVTGILSRLKQILPCNILLTIYNSLVLSHINSFCTT